MLFHCLYFALGFFKNAFEYLYVLQLAETQFSQMFNISIFVYVCTYACVFAYVCYTCALQAYIHTNILLVWKKNSFMPQTCTRLRLEMTGVHLILFYFISKNKIVSVWRMELVYEHGLKVNNSVWTKRNRWFKNHV